MKILGFEINRAERHNESVVKVPANVQNTKPSLPLKSSFPRAELGDSGTRMLHGIITQEYNPNLQGIQGIKVYDEMRKSDGTVRAAVLAITLPIRRAQWFVNPATEENQQDKDIANFLEHALFDWLDVSWDDVVRQALLSVSFGVMPFEKIYGTKEHEGKTFVTIKKLAPRLPQSILQWELSDGSFGIKQVRQDGQIAEIPGSKLLVFINEREGDNWWGLSMLRGAYKHWYFKNNFYKIDGMAFERQGLGVPVIKMPDGYTDSDEKKAVQALQNLRANEDAYLLLPMAYEFEFANMGASSTRDPQNSINHHNKEILQSVLAQFLELGANKSGSGSRALSQDHSDLFLKALEAIANNFISEINKNLIPELVDMNFDNVTVYPKLDYSGITKIDVGALGTAYSQLVTAGAITPTDDDQQYLRAAMGLPPRTQEDIDAEDDQDPSENDQVDHADIEKTNKPAPKGPAKTSPADNKAKTKKDNKTIDTASGKKKPEVKAHEDLNPRTFDDGKGFMTWRKLTFAEKKVGWKSIEDTMNSMQDDFTKESKDLINNAKDDFMKKLQVAIENNDTKAISALEVKFISDYKAAIKNAMKKAYEYGKIKAANEMGVNPPPNTADSLAEIDLLADSIANKAAVDIETKAKISVANALRKDASPLQALGTIDATLEDTITKTVGNAAGLIVGQGMNIGRNDVFERNRGMIYALQRSEVLDERTCEFCLSMDGLVITPDDGWASEGEFHSNCRGIWVEIMNEESELPDITGVPSEIGDYYGGEPNSLIQPTKAIVLPNSPAAGEVARRAEEKKKK